MGADVDSVAAVHEVEVEDEDDIDEVASGPKSSVYEWVPERGW
jgi:hypothetical protein